MSVLIEARKLISDPERWLQGRYAETAGHLPCFPKDEKAVSFCSVGAVVHVLPEQTIPEREVRQLSAAVHALDPGWLATYRQEHPHTRFERCIAQYNDTHTHEEVLAVWDLAIAEEAQTS